MRAKRKRWIWSCFWALCPLGGLQAQFCTGDDEGGARWGLEYTGGVMVKPLLQENQQQVPMGRGQWESVRGEYFCRRNGVSKRGTIVRYWIMDSQTGRWKASR